MGDRGCLSLFGPAAPASQQSAASQSSTGRAGKDARLHELLAEHVTRSERWTDLTGQYGTVREWLMLPSRSDNHWLDCLVGCAAAASMLGVSLFRGATPKKVKRKRKHVAYLP